MANKGFIPIVFVLVCALIGIGAVFGIPYVYKVVQNKLAQVNPSVTEIPSAVPSPTNQTKTPTPTPVVVSNTPTSKTITNAATKTPTPKPAATPTTSSSTTTSSCNYDLSAATGAIQFIFNPTNGSSLYWSTVGEVKALNGCKVLDGKSTDTIQRFKSAGSNYLSLPGIPPGTYQVRFSYHDSWSSTQTISVSSGQQTNTSFSVNNSSDPVPTPTPNQKPVCTTPVVTPSTTGTHPFTVTLYIGYSSNPPSNSSSDLQTIMWDFNGDGTYDYNIGYGNPYDYTYQNAGTYTLKGSICKTGGTICSDPCETTITVN